MTVTLIFLAVLMAAFTAWLLRQTIGVEPWSAGEDGAAQRQLPESATAGRVGLGVFLAVVASLFALGISAYMMRMEFGPDWQPLPVPGLLWANSAVLVLASVFLQWAWNAARSGNARALRTAMIAGGAATIVFIAGQCLVWLQLRGSGFHMAGNVANAFFYLLTALHALHLVGGLFAWGRSMLPLWRGASPAEVRPGVELCAVYWHFLLLIWVILFTLLLNT